jgi:hypothetical protein
LAIAWTIKKTVVFEDKHKKIFGMTALITFFAASIFIPGLRAFWMNDPALAVLFFLGLTALTLSLRHNGLLAFCAIGMVGLGIFYYQVNPLMQRYWTNVIPFMLILVGASAIYAKKLPKFALAMLVIFTAWQSWLTLGGIRDWHGGIWQQQGYEESSAKSLNQHLKPDDLLIVSFPEPYYYFTRHSTHSINDNFPYVYVPDALDEREVVVVEDMGMRQVFPNFSRMAQEGLGEYKLTEYRTNTKYRYTTTVIEEQGPVIAYRLKLATLKEIINETNSPSPVLQ